MDKKFKLEKVLNYRVLQLDIEKAKLAKLNFEEHSIKTALDDMNTVIDNKRNEQSGEAAKGNLEFSTLYDKFIQLSIIKASFLEKDLDAKQFEIKDQQVRVNKSLQDFKIMEKLETKHKLEYIKYLNKLEQLQIDEINITRSKV